MLETALQAGFAVAIVIVAASIWVASFGRARPRALLYATVALGLAATASWIAFGFEPTQEVAVLAAAMTLAAFAGAAAVALARAVDRARADENALARARETIDRMIVEETEQISADLQRWLARMRADTISLLTDEERRLGEERRAELAEREERVAAQLADALAVVERRVEDRLRGWSDDLDRAQQGLGTQLARLEQRQRQLIGEAEARIEAEADELVTTSDTQRATVIRLREELERSAQAAVAEALDELETHTSERRKSIEEIAERLRAREESLSEQIERSEAEALRRIEATFADVERRQVEQLTRLVAREAERYAEAAGLQFEGMMKSAREEAAGRLGRELDRAIESFARQADGIFAERLAHTGDAGQQRLEARLRQTHAAFDRQREELAESFTRRISEADAELRRTLGSLMAEAESERSVLEARLLELARRIDDAHAGLSQR
jgi:hypothetical protein